MNLTKQGYYNLIVYDSDPEDIYHLFERTGDMKAEEYIENINTALDFIQDRFDMREYGEGVNPEDNETSHTDLFHKAVMLEKIRYEVIGDAYEPDMSFSDPYEPHIDLNAVLDI